MKAYVWIEKSWTPKLQREGNVDYAGFCTMSTDLSGYAETSKCSETVPKSGNHCRLSGRRGLLYPSRDVNRSMDSRD